MIPPYPGEPVGGLGWIGRLWRGITEPCGVRRGRVGVVDRLSYNITYLHGNLFRFIRCVRAPHTGVLIRRRTVQSATGV